MLTMDVEESLSDGINLNPNKVGSHFLNGGTVDTFHSEERQDSNDNEDKVT